MMKDLEENEEHNDRPLREIQRALAHNNEEFAAALTDNGISWGSHLKIRVISDNIVQVLKCTRNKAKPLYSIHLCYLK